MGVNIDIRTMRVDPCFLLLFLTLTALQCFCQPLADEKNTTKISSMRGSRMRSLSGDGDIVLVDDMLLRPDQYLEEEAERDARTPGLVKKKWRWPKSTVVPFKISKSFTSSQEKRIRETILVKLQKRLGACIVFKELKLLVPKSRGFISVEPDKKKCSSSVGNQGKKQVIRLAPYCLKRRKLGKIQHEFLHALGLYHTQMRRDRDNYIIVHKKNIKKGSQRNFRKNIGRKTKNYKLPYDYGSIMHYSEDAFNGGSGKKTIETMKKKNQDKIGQRERLSRGDVKLIKKMYKCE